ncbi:MAG: hypothetical protein KF878_00790 [Planctomycetes bacterium]|nr:hypothetical protein [Planctomycetota bacterium]
MRAVVALLLCLACGPAPGQEPPPARVVLDEWTASFYGGRKSGWQHLRIEERPGAAPGAVAFVVEARSWSPVAAGEVRTTARTETDAGGRVLREEGAVETPWGPTRYSAELARDELRYAVRVRDLPEVSGKAEAAWSVDVVELLVLRGAQPPGKRTLRLLVLPGDGSEEREVEVRREGDRWRTAVRERFHERNRAGLFVRGGHREQPGLLTLPSSEEDAPLAAEPPADAPATPDALELGPLRIARPGPDWRGMRANEDARGIGMSGVEHPAGVAVILMRVPMRLPADGAERLRLADAMRQGMNERARKDGEVRGPELGEPAVATWSGLPAARYDLGGRIAMAPITGEAHLVGCSDGSSVLVIVAWAADLAEALAAEVAQARAAVTLSSAAAAPWARLTLGHATLELPRGWALAAEGGGLARSPLGASLVNVISDRLPEGLDLARAQDLWVAQQRQNRSIARLEVERQGEAEVGGRRGVMTVVRGKLVENKGVAPVMRCASFAFERDDGTFVEIVIVAFDLDWDPDAIERVMESVRWIEQH